MVQLWTESQARLKLQPSPIYKATSAVKSATKPLAADVFFRGSRPVSI